MMQPIEWLNYGISIGLAIGAMAGILGFISVCGWYSEYEAYVKKRKLEKEELATLKAASLKLRRRVK